MKFYDSDGHLIWESITCNIPPEYFVGDSSNIPFFLTSGKEKSYVKKFGNVDYFFGNVAVGANQTFELMNGSKINFNRQHYGSGILNLYTKWDDAYPYNGLFTIDLSEVPSGSGNYYLTRNVFWQPDGAGAAIVGIMYRLINNDLTVQYYRVERWARISAWSDTQIQIHIDFFMGTDDSDDDVSTTAGGTGGYDNTSTTDIGFPTLPNVSLLESDMIHGYALTVAQSNDLSAWFWSTSILDQINQALKTDPMQSILSFGILPIDPPHSPNQTYIDVGTITSDSAQGYLMTNEWTIINFGTFTVPETWGSFIDYSSTSLQVYLPYIGTEDLDINECMNSELHLKYYINCITGDCVAFLKISKNPEGKNIAAVNSVLYQWTGNMLVQCPITGGDFSERISGIINGFQKSVAGALGDNWGQYASGMSEMILESQKSKAKHSGAMNLIDGYMGIQYPYLILDRPSQSIPANFNKYNGRVSNITSTLQQMIGYTEIESCRLDSVSATDTEKAEIMSLLKSGVIV